MKLVNFNENYSQKIVLALGFFDSLHIGHRQILNTAREMAMRKNCQTALFTFSNNMFEALGRQDKLIYTFKERIAIIERLGIDNVIFAEFNKDFMGMSSCDFLTKLDNFDLSGVVCGYDYTFGSDKATPNIMEEYCKNRGIEFYMQSAILHDNIKVSSTAIRHELLDGNITKANFYLVDNFSISGVVARGRQDGTKIGFPTANIITNEDKLLPIGVYGGHIELNGENYNTICNIGTRPTFGIDKIGVEVHIINYYGNLYGRHITVYIDKYIRGIKKFFTLEQLKRQINNDISECEL